MNQPRNISKDPLHVPNGPMTRSKTKTLKETLNALVLKVSTKTELKSPLEYQEETLVHLIHVEEGPIQPYLGHEVSTTKGPKESYYNMGLMGLMEDYKNRKVLWALFKFVS